MKFTVDPWDPSYGSAMEAVLDAALRAASQIVAHHAAAKAPRPI